MAKLIKDKLLDKIVETLKDKIIRGVLKEGDKLPPQGKLAEDLGISRGTLREGLTQLAMVGLVEMRQGSGTYIKSFNPSAYLTPIASALLIDKVTAIELLEARVFIEGSAASLSAKRAIPEQISKLKSTLDRMTLNFINKDIDAYIKEDVNFHLTIAEMSKNRVLLRVLETIRESLYPLIAHFSTTPESIQNVLYHHKRIYTAILRHDPVRAKKEMESHLVSLMRRASNSWPSTNAT